MAQKVNVSQICKFLPDGTVPCDGACVTICNGEISFTSFSGASHQGSVSGYTGLGCGDCFLYNHSLTSDTNSTNVGQIRVGSITKAGGNASCSDGYFSGGYPATSPITSSIIKFPYAAEGAGEITYGSVPYAAGGMGTHQSSSTAYISGGGGNPSIPTTGCCLSSFPFANETGTVANIGGLSAPFFSHSSHSSDTHGYLAACCCMRKFSFTSLAETVTGSTTFFKEGSWSTSATHGYSAGGCAASPGNVSIAGIVKYPYSADTNATSVGSLTESLRGSAGFSSTTHGYNAAGTPINLARCIVQKYSFASDENATAVSCTACNKTMSGNIQI